MRQAAVLCELGRYPEAERLLSQVVASDPQNSGAWCLMSQARLGSKRPREALEAAQRASAITPDEEWSHRLMSLAWTGLGDRQSAVASAKEAVRLAPHEWRAHLRLAAALRVLPDLPASHGPLERALELAPDQPDVHMVAGSIAAAEGRRTDAAESYRQVLALDPDHSGAHQGLASLHVRRAALANAHAGRLAAAAGGFAAAIRADPTSASSRRALDAVLALFQRLLAYFIFLDAFVANATQHSDSAGARAIPVVLLAGPIAYAAWFVIRLPHSLRPYLLRSAVRGGRSVATVLEVFAIGAIVASAVVGTTSRSTFIGLALFAALLARVVLWAVQKRQNA